MLEGGRAAGRHPHRPAGERDPGGRADLSEGAWRRCASTPDREGGLPGLAEGCAPKQRESHAGSARGAGPGVGGPERRKIGAGGGRAGWVAGPQTERSSHRHHPSKNCLGLEQSTSGSKTLCHFLIHT